MFMSFPINFAFCVILATSQTNNPTNSPAIYPTLCPANFRRRLTGGSCAGQCGGGPFGTPSNECFCTPDCIDIGDCCSDFESACPNFVNPTPFCNPDKCGNSGPFTDPLYNVPCSCDLGSCDTQAIDCCYDAFDCGGIVNTGQPMNTMNPPFPPDTDAPTSTPTSIPTNTPTKSPIQNDTNPFITTNVPITTMTTLPGNTMNTPGNTMGFPDFCVNKCGQLIPDDGNFPPCSCKTDCESLFGGNPSNFDNICCPDANICGANITLPDTTPGGSIFPQSTSGGNGNGHNHGGNGNGNIILPKYASWYSMVTDDLPCYKDYSNRNQRLTSDYESDVKKWSYYFNVQFYMYNMDNPSRALESDDLNIFLNNKTASDYIGDMLHHSINIPHECCPSCSTRDETELPPWVLQNRYIWVDPSSFIFIDTFTDDNIPYIVNKSALNDPFRFGNFNQSQQTLPPNININEFSNVDAQSLCYDDFCVGQVPVVGMTGVIMFNATIYLETISDVQIWAELMHEMFQSTTQFDDDSLPPRRRLTQGLGAQQWNWDSHEFSLIQTSLTWMLRQRFGKCNIGIFFGFGDVLESNPNPFPAPLTTEFNTEIIDFVVLMAILLFGGLLSLLAYMHSKGCIKCINFTLGCRPADDIMWSAIIIYLLQLLDFYSDCIFSYRIYDTWYKDKERNDIGIILFILCVLFIIVPYTVNVFGSCFLKNRIEYNRMAVSWFIQYSTLYSGLVIISGGAIASLSLVSSKLFGMRVFSTGLTSIDFIQFKGYKVFYTVILENLPQLVLQIIYIVTYGAGNTLTQPATIAAFISSSVAIVVSIFSYILTAQFNMNRIITSLVITFNSNSLDEDKEKLEKYSSHQRRKIGKLLANELELNPDSLTIIRIKETNIGCIIDLSIIISGNMDINKIINDAIGAGEVIEFRKNIKNWLQLKEIPSNIQHNSDELRELRILNTSTKYQSQTQTNNDINGETKGKGTNDEVMMTKVINNDNDTMGDTSSGDNNTDNKTDNEYIQAGTNNGDVIDGENDNDFKSYIIKNGFSAKVHDILIENQIESIEDLKILNEFTADDWKDVQGIKIVARKKLIALAKKLDEPNDTNNNDSNTNNGNVTDGDAVATPDGTASTNIVIPNKTTNTATNEPENAPTNNNESNDAIKNTDEMV